MRRANADYDAVESALKAHQLRTLHDYARAQGYSADDWRKDTLCCTLAVWLAVKNLVERRTAEGVSRKNALRDAAIAFDVDVGTLEGHWRAIQQRNR